MSDEVQKPINTMLPTIYNRLGVMPITSLKSISGHGIFENAVEQYFSRQTEEVMKKIRELEENTLSISEKIYEKRVTLDEQLFDAKANVKILLSQVSMHFSDTLRKKLFHQIDLLHDPDDWEDGDDPIQLQSFKTFLRWFYLYKPPQLPNFGLSNTGHFIASWLTNHNKDSLILEFLSDDRITWFVTEYYDEEADHGSGSTKLSRIADVLAPYHSDNWFIKET
ncbi:MAG: hypothetical protein O7D86_08830 [Proteobacteria bacterium]|nr:hypothetical protein [Pseudomonadota bacterium]